MDFNGIKEIIEIINTSEIAYFDYKTSDGHLVLDKSLVRNSKGEAVAPINNVENIIDTTNKVSVTTVDREISKEEKEKVDSDLYTVTSPMVGTFYSSSSPDSEAFVKVEDTIEKGKVLCIVEAMKLMNEIESEVTGTIKRILVKDGDMVQYGQPLFLIKEE